jgi:26S proteasome regulatory subunit N2
MVGLTSAAGVVGLLSEPDADLQIFALQKLNEQIDSLWTEVAGSVGEIEALYEDESFPERQLAALVASKVYYNLQEYNESMVFALGAGRLFDIDKEGEFEDTIISKCVDTYIALSATQKPDAATSVSKQGPPQLITSFPASSNGAASTSAVLASPTTPFSQSTLPSKSLLSRQGSVSYDPSSAAETVGAASTPNLPLPIQKQLHAIIERLFERCFQEGRYKQVVGIAIEARNLEKLRQAILRSRQDNVKGKRTSKDEADQSEELMDYVLDICMSVVQERSLRNEVG